MSRPSGRAAVLALDVAADGGPAALLPVGNTAAVERITAQLRAHGVGDVRVLTRPEWSDALANVLPDDTAVVDVVRVGDVAAAFASTAGDDRAPLLVVSGNLVAHDGVISAAVFDRRGPSALLPLDAGVRAGRCDGVLRIGHQHRSRFIDVVQHVTGTDDVAADVQRMLDRVCDHVPVTVLSPDGLVATRPRSREQASKAARLLTAVDEDAIRLDAAVKPEDGFFTTFFVSPYSRYIARWGARRGITPNQVTIASLLVGAAAAVAFSAGTRAGLVTGAVLLQTSFIADCVDGQLARYSRSFTALGGWLDATFDRAKETLVLAGLAIGGVRLGDDNTLWLLAAAALALQTVRHMVWSAYVPQEPGRHDEATGIAAVGVDMAARFERRAVLRWAKRIVVLPIGERFALISATAALTVPRVTFVALLSWGSVALAYTVAGRVLRSLG